MKPLRFTALAMALVATSFLAGCDNSGAPQAAVTKAADADPKPVAKVDSAQREKLAAQSAGKNPVPAGCLRGAA